MGAGETLTIAVLGTGRMGTALASAFARAGHRVVFGSRDPARARSGTPAWPEIVGARDAILLADLAVLATLWQDTPEMLRHAGDFGGKVLIDATNPEKAIGRGLALGHTTSGAEEIARLAPSARVVKAFNHVYAELLDRGRDFGGVHASIFLCGDDGEARGLAARLIADCGFVPVDVGELSAARFLEPAAALMVELVRGRGREPGGIALHLLERS